MECLRTAAKLLPAPLRRPCRDFINQQVWGLARQFVRSRRSELAVTLDMVLSDFRSRHRDVFFLQVGALDGVSADPLYSLVEKHELRGILVEPQADFFNQLRSNYAAFGPSRFVFVNAAIAETDGRRSLYRIRAGSSGPSWMHGTASFDRHSVTKHRRAIPNVESLVTVEEVRCITFATLFRETQAEHVDLLQIDAEGYDAKILQFFDLPARMPAIVRFEHTHLPQDDHLRCLNNLIQLGYGISVGVEDTLAYLRKQ